MVTPTPLQKVATLSAEAFFLPTLKDGGLVPHDVDGSLAFEPQPVVSPVRKFSGRAARGPLENPPVWEVRCRVKQSRGKADQL